MGGCCCSSRKPQLHVHGTPVYYYCPPILEEHESFTSRDSATTVLTAGFLVDLNLDMSSPDTFRPPPAPIPYDMVLGCPELKESECLKEISNGSGLGNLSMPVDLKGPDCSTDSGTFLASPKKIEFELLRSNDLTAMEEEDACPTCFEEYDAENPKVITECNHHFHLSCILQWMERSDTCPICNQEMKFQAT